jgi:hypothetical protein
MNGLTKMNKHLKLFIGFGTIAFSMTAYISLMGMSANRASAIAVHDLTQDLLNNWHYIATTLEVPSRNTKPGLLAPVIPENFGALDLTIYGAELVTPEYKAFYKALDMPKMVDRLHIRNLDDVLQYNVGGLQLLSIQDTDGVGGAAFYMDVPEQIIEEASQLYDGHPMKGDRDGEGIVRYDRTPDGNFVMGLYLSYGPPTS